MTHSFFKQRMKEDRSTQPVSEAKATPTVDSANHKMLSSDSVDEEKIQTTEEVITTTTTSNENTKNGQHLSSASTTPSPSSSMPLKEEKQDTIIEPAASSSRKPNKGRLFVRFWQSIAAIGAFGFQIGASPYSNVPYVFQDRKLQYYTYAIDLVSLLWALFMIYVYITRRFGSRTGKVRRPISFAVDTALAALFGVATFYQFASYNCPPGQFNGWCDFHNTGRFFLLSLFLSYGVSLLWDLFGSCSCLRKKE